MPQDLAHCLAAALNKRLRPEGPTMVKTLCGQIGISEDTLSRLRHGELPRAMVVLSRLIDYFGPDFRKEVLGEICEQPLWFDDAGGVRQVWDLADAAREFQGLPPGISGDHAAALRRNQGWISAAVNVNGLAIVRYHERGLAPMAVKRAEAYLLETRGILAVRRVVDLREHDDSTRTVINPHELPAATTAALERASACSHLPSPRPWRVQRASLDQVGGHYGTKLLGIAAIETPDTMMTALSNARLLHRTSMLQEHDGVIYSISLCEQINLPPAVRASMIGPVRGLGDTRYGEMIEACVRETLVFGAPTCRIIRGSLYGKQVYYMQIAFVAANRTYISYTEPLAEAA